MKYFKKEVPKTPIILPNGTSLKFDTLDGQTGYFATEDKEALDAFAKLQKQGIGGISEIGAQEYETNFTQKKSSSSSSSSSSHWREEIGGGIAQDTSLRRETEPTAAAAVAAEQKKIEPPPKAGPEPSKPIAFKPPNIGRRPPK